MRSVLFLILGLFSAFALVHSESVVKSARGQEIEYPVEIPERFRNAMFKTDSFTFVRIKYTSRADRGRLGRWATDYPDADRNLSRHLTQFSTLDVDLEGRVMELTDPGLGDSTSQGYRALFSTRLVAPK